MPTPKDPITIDARLEVMYDSTLDTRPDICSPTNRISTSSPLMWEHPLIPSRQQTTQTTTEQLATPTANEPGRDITHVDYTDPVVLVLDTRHNQLEYASTICHPSDHPRTHLSSTGTARPRHICNKCMATSMEHSTAETFAE